MSKPGKDKVPVMEIRSVLWNDMKDKDQVIRVHGCLDDAMDRIMDLNPNLTYNNNGNDLMFEDPKKPGVIQASISCRVVVVTTTLQRKGGFSKTMLPPSRTGIISWLAAFNGGHNSSPPVSWGRLNMQIKDMKDDEAVARYLYNEIKADAEKPLKKEITELKAQLFDAMKPKKKKKSK